MHLIKPLSATFLALTLGLTASCGHATSGQFGSLTEIALQQHFTLTDGLLARYEAAHADVHANPCNTIPTPDMKALRRGQAPSFDDVAAQYDAQPAMHAILTRHSISAKDYLLTQAVLGAGRMKYAHQMMEKVNPQAAGNIDSSETIISAANYSFFLAHRNQIQQATLREMHSTSATEASRNLNCMANKLKGK